MKQIVQDIQSGETKVMEAPIPSVAAGMVLVRTEASLVSPGTERSIVSFADSSLLGKARQRPDLVKQVLDKVRREGLLTAIQAVRSRLDEPLPLGYSSAGTVTAVGNGVAAVRPGDRVACGGGGFAVHAEYALVPKNLVALVPEGVSLESACFATLGSVALHGFRLSGAEISGRVAVIGLGLLGQLALRIAAAAGCQTLGIDLSPWRVEWTQQQGLPAVLRQNAEEAAASASDGHGFDAVLICADSTTSDPVELAGVLARDRAKVVAIGAVGMDLPRRPYYDKELSFVVSRSYGPGRYDPGYEEAGVDYPIGYVRWPEGRNLKAMVDLMADGKLKLEGLVTHRFPIAQAPQAYELITSDRGEQALAVLLQYPQANGVHAESSRVEFSRVEPTSSVRLGAVGAGNFANNVLFPLLKGSRDLDLVGLASRRGLNSAQAAARFGFRYAVSDISELLQDDSINTIAILTRHNLHADQTQAALRSGRHVFCEKPLALSWEELEAVQQTLAEAKGLLMVGFNRRFAPLLAAAKEAFASIDQPKMMVYRVNAGALPDNHWLRDPAIGGGRLVGEACHFVDALCYLAGSLPRQVYARSLAQAGDSDFAVTMDFADGSVGSIVYSSGGDRSMGKERLEIFAGGKSAALDDFRRLELYSGGRHRSRRSLWSQDKGHEAIWDAFTRAIASGGPPPISYGELMAVSEATLAARDSLASGKPVALGESGSTLPE
jgi:predicted dehydrogenase/threonine dehydrogenase-like Zn-dependent dehydrogenase